ncbi:MAG TPA: nicotinamide riboside transporter PnuC [Woeseiaceae bacterium]
MESLLTEQIEALSLVETIAVLAAVLYLVLAIRRNIWCWFFAGVSTAIYVVLFIDARLYMESMLNVFYFAMAIYGWYFWYTGSGAAPPPIIRWPFRNHAIAIVVIAALSLLFGYLLERHTDAVFPYIDSLTTFAAIWATFLVARKVLENWWYWLVIDSVSIFIYWARELPMTALLFAVYVVMIPFGLVAWTRAMHEQTASQP